MIDFTLGAYKAYLRAISNTYPRIVTFDTYFKVEKSAKEFCMIRHDVDRFPGRALRMAEVEHSMGISSTYYFRSKNHTFRPNLLSKIHRLGHEVGYHYECLADTQGIMGAALQNFETQLSRFNQIVPVTTIAMHGRPFNAYDSRDMWRINEHRQALRERYGILGEVYIDIDYSEILYITDTGRNWKIGASNRRDRVDSNILLDFESGAQLISYLEDRPHPKLIFQIHPERWTDNLPAYAIQWMLDKATNLAKAIFDG